MRQEILQTAAKWIRKEMSKKPNKLQHPSHDAARILKEADKKFDLRSYGVEGWSDKSVRTGVQYLNYGDPYEATIVIRSSPNHYCVHIALGGWGPYAP